MAILHSSGQYFPETSGFYKILLWHSRTLVFCIMHCIVSPLRYIFLLVFSFLTSKFSNLSIYETACRLAVCVSLYFSGITLLFYNFLAAISDCKGCMSTTFQVQKFHYGSCFLTKYAILKFLVVKHKYSDRCDEKGWANSSYINSCKLQSSACISSCSQSTLWTANRNEDKKR